MPPARPRILQCISRFGLGGAEQVAVNLATHFANEFDCAVHAVRGTRPRDDSGRILLDRLGRAHVPVTGGFPVGLRLGGALTSGLQLARVLRRFDPDIVQLHTEIPEAAAAAAIGLRLGGRSRAWIRTAHSPVFWIFAPPLAHWCDRRLVQAGVHEIAVSHSAAAAVGDLHRRANIAPLPAAPRIIPNGVALPEATNRRQPDPSVRRLLMGGRWTRQKGTDLLPAILRATRLPSGVRAELDLFGSGEHAAQLQALATTPPEGWTIRLHPPKAHFSQRLRDADLLLLPSRFEGLPLVALEAIGAGVPVLTTDAPGCDEVLPSSHRYRAPAEDVAGFAAVLSKALAEPELWRQVAAHARAFAAERFSLHAMFGGYRAVYQEILDRPKP